MTAMARIFLIDDDQALLDVLSMAFEDAGHTVMVARDGAQGLAGIRKQRPDLVVSDVNMPALDGFKLCQILRSEGFDVPIILLTGRDNEIDEALGLDLGADDYVAKPFSTRVLLARLQSLLRRHEVRSERPAGTNIPNTIGALQLDPDRMEVRYRGVPVTVTVTEYRLLEALAQNPGVIRSREKLLAMVRDDNSVVAVRIIDTYIRRLRRKLETVDSRFDEIETVVGAGYRWKARER